MNEDDILVDDYNASEMGIYEVEEDQERVQEENEERALTTGASPLIGVILNRFDEEIDRARSIDGLKPESSVKLEAQILAKQELVKMLRDVRGRIETLRADHLPN